MYKCFAVRLVASFISGLCALGVQAQSITVIDQMPAAGFYSQGFVSDTECTIGSSLATSAFADDFRVQPPAGKAALAVSSVEFIGRYPVAAAPNDPTPFLIRFRTDAAGLPGALLASPAASVSQTPLASGVYRFSASFSPVVLGPGFYWLEVVESGNATTDCMQWVIGPLDGVNGRDGSAGDYDLDGPGGWYAQLNPSGEGDNMAMRILAEPVSGTPPSPPAVTAVPTLAGESLFLLGGLLAMAGLASRRRIKNGNAR